MFNLLPSGGDHALFAFVSSLLSSAPIDRGWGVGGVLFVPAGPGLRLLHGGAGEKRQGLRF